MSELMKVNIELLQEQVDAIVIGRLKEDYDFLVNREEGQYVHPDDEACNKRIVAALTTILSEWFGEEL